LSSDHITIYAFSDNPSVSCINGWARVEVIFKAIVNIEPIADGSIIFNCQVTGLIKLGNFREIDICKMRIASGI